MLSASNNLAQRLAFFLILVCILAATSIASLYLSDDLIPRIIMSSFVFLSLYLGFKIAKPSDTSKPDVKIEILKVTSSACLGIIQFYQKTFIEYFHAAAKSASTIGPLDLANTGIELQVIAVVAFLLVLVAMTIVMYMVLYKYTDRPAMGRPHIPIADVLPAVTNLDRIQQLKQALKYRLDRIDQSTQWSDVNYVPLEAEVQVLEGRYSRLKIVDLLEALRRDQSTSIFVILGEPGSGKSVAMRKLTRDLLSESKVADRIPVYINLKEWKIDKKWTIDHPPTTADFHKFITSNLFDDLDYHSQSFLRFRDSKTGKTNFEALHEEGFFFFVLDSFDEIPAVLDHNEESWLIEALSSVIVNYVVVGRKTRGVVSSRLFRKPNIIHEKRSIFEIRPFSDDRVIKAIESAANDPAQLTRAIFGDRLDLGMLARNPFILHLIISYYNATQRAPASQAEMFDTYISEHLRFARESYRFSSVSDDEIWVICENIAHFMFSHPNAGLEVSEIEIVNHINQEPVRAVLSFLAQSRIGRLGGDSRAFSFSHRRFNEFFFGQLDSKAGRKCSL
jgi:hypothetical protein